MIKCTIILEVNDLLVIAKLESKCESQEPDIVAYAKR